MDSKINWNLQDMPQLVIAKIMTFLNHKQLLVLEQVSKQFNCSVDDHFRTTDHLILGSLPSIVKLEQNKKLLQVIQRCGIRLRTIQFNNNQFIDDYEMYWLLQLYIDHLFESGGEVISKTCPNIEHIITSPKLVTKSKFFNGQVVGLSLAKSYVNHLYKMGNKCKLRAINIHFNEFDEEFDEEKTFKVIVDCYPNLQHILFSHSKHQQFLRYLPQLINNGLKDLKIDKYSVDIEDAVEYCKIGINLRTLTFAVWLESNDDIASINQLKLPKGLKLEMFGTDCSFLALLNENVCDSVVKMVCHKDDTSDCSSIIKLKNLGEFEGRNLEQAKLIAKESFPELKQLYLHKSVSIGCNLCHETLALGYRSSKCMYICLPELLTSKGHQLTVISVEVCSSLDLVVKAVKYCKAALKVNLSCALNLNPCTTSITIEDFMAILQLSNLEKFSITHIVRASSDIDDLQQKMKIAENTQSSFKFEYGKKKVYGRLISYYSFERIDI